jgi:hypothetical protein
MSGKLAIAVLALLGLLCAAGMGVAAYVVSRDSVAVPVTRLQPKPRGLTPANVRSRPRTQPRTTATIPAPPPPPATTVDDHGGGGGDNSGPGGGGGHGGGDD